jgi:hypothetical protein
MYKMLQSYKVHAGASSLSFSQTGLLGAGIGSVVQVGHLGMQLFRNVDYNVLSFCSSYMSRGSAHAHHLPATPGTHKKKKKIYF